MRIVSLEEHLIFPDLVGTIPQENWPEHNRQQSPQMKKMEPLLEDIEGERLKSMDESGISMQILSVVGMGASMLSPVHASAFAKAYNSRLAEQIRAYPDRFSAFAHLPLTAPAAAADELERTITEFGFKGALINGLTMDLFLDHAQFAPFLERAQHLGVPIYLHPGLPPLAVENAYYSDLPKNAGKLLSIAGWGWHSETALHILRLIVSGTLDKYPELKIIIGHMGEMLPMMMERIEQMFGVNRAAVNQRSVIQTLKDQVFITTSGIFTQPPLQLAIDTFGIDNIMFSVDYPFSTNEQGKTFLDGMNLSAGDKLKIASGNADRLLKLV